MLQLSPSVSKSLLPPTAGDFIALTIMSQVSGCLRHKISISLKASSLFWKFWRMFFRRSVSTLSWIPMFSHSLDSWPAIRKFCKSGKSSLLNVPIHMYRISVLRKFVPGTWRSSHFFYILLLGCPLLKVKIKGQ